MTRLGLLASLLALPALAVEPTWAHAVDVSGRAFVADKALLIASDVAKPTTKPAAKAPAEVGPWAASNFKEKVHETVALSSLKKEGAHYAAANGLQLGADYVDFLAERVGGKHVSFGFRGSCQPVVVVVKGKPAGLLMPLSVPGSAVEAPPEPAWVGVARLADGTRFLLDASFIFSEAQLGQMPQSHAGLRELPPKDVAAVEAWMSTRVKQPIHLADLRCGAKPGTYEGPGGLLLNARYVDYLRARVDLWPLELHAKAPLEPVSLVMKGRAAGVLMPMKP
jgi:hypothetical protein